MSGHVLLFPARGPAATSRRIACGSGESLAARWVGALARAVRVLESRRALGAMDDRMLADVGLTRAEALTEAGRWPWDVAAARNRTR